MMVVLMVVVGSGGAQEARDGTGLRERVFDYLGTEDRKEAEEKLKALLSEGSWTVEEVDRALDLGPVLKEVERGRIKAIQLKIPGTEVMTSYELLVPKEGSFEKKRPLWMVIHGTGGNGRFALRAFEDSLKDKDCILAAPTEGKDLEGVGWAFKPRERALHLACLEDVARKYAVDRDRVYATGWSRGGHAAFDLGFHHGDRLAGIGPIIGTVTRRDLPLVPTLRNLRIHTINGLNDDPPLVKGAIAAMERLQTIGAEATFRLFPNRGHEGFIEELPVLVADLSESRRDVAPRKFELHLRDLEAGRKFYVRVLAFRGKVYKPGEQLQIPGSETMSQEELEEAVARTIEEQTPRLRMNVVDNTFDLSVRGIKKIDLFVPEALIDRTRGITVRWNGIVKVKDRRFGKATPKRRLELLREFAGRDSSFRFVEKITLTAE